MYLKGILGLVLSYRGSMSKWESVTFEESLSFVKRVKVRKILNGTSIHASSQNDNKKKRGVTVVNLLSVDRQTIWVCLVRAQNILC